jgi:hypothetical protein
MAQETPAQSRFDPLSAAWRAFSAPQTLLVLVGLLSLALALGVILPQIPPQAAGDPAAWLAVRLGRLGPVGNLLLLLGLFDVFHSFWFRVLLALIALSLFVRTVDSAELAWYATGRRPWPATPSSFGSRHPPESRLETALDLDQAQAQLGILFDRLGYWWTEAPNSPVWTVILARRRIALWARPLGYAALIVALLGLAIAGTWGWQGQEWQPLPGESRAVAQGTPYVIRLDAFHLDVDDAEWLQTYSSQITWLEGESEVQQDTIRMGRASTRSGATVRQVGFVPVVRLRGWDSEGRLLTLETAEDALSLIGEVEIRFTSSEAQPLVLVQGHDVFLALTFEPVCTQDKPALYVEPIRAESSEPEARQVLYESGSVMVDNLRFELELLFVPVLRADFYPAMGLVLLSLVLLAISLVALWLAPPKVAWISAGSTQDEDTLLRLQTLPGARSHRLLSDLAHHLEKGLSSDV